MTKNGTRNSINSICNIPWNPFWALQPAGLRRYLKCFRSATHYASLGGKEPDQAWKPCLNPNVQILAERRAQGRLF